MILDDELVAHHGRVLARLLSDRHVGAAVRDGMRRRSSRFRAGETRIGLQSGLTSASLVAGPGRLRLNGVSFFSQWEGPARLTNDAQEGGGRLVGGAAAQRLGDELHVSAHPPIPFLCQV